jgi:formyl-CoA transferase
MFVPTAGAVLADLGADVIKIEPPTGDPFRAIQTLALQVTALDEEQGHPFSDTSPLVHIVNRSKRSMSLDLTTDEGRELLYELVKDADVFLTSFQGNARTKLKIEPEDLFKINPRLIYGRGTGWGPKGPFNGQPGFDIVSAWASSGLSEQMTLQSGEPEPMPPGFFDIPSGTGLASGVGAALYQREKTGKGSIVDVSLLQTAWWQMAPSIVSAPYNDGADPLRGMRRKAPGNPLVNAYKTSDGRWIFLCLIVPDKQWPALCNVLGRSDMIDDPRYSTAEGRATNREACVVDIDAAFAKHTLEEWKAILADFPGAWAPALTPAEVHQHPQGPANGYLPEVTGANGQTFRLVAPPYQFDEEQIVPSGPAPEFAQHTEEILLEMGYDWDRIGELRESGALG